MTAVVFDCVIFLQAAANKYGPAAACLDLVERGKAGLFLSPAILAEVREVFYRPSVRRAFPALTDDGVATFLAKVTSLAVVLDVVPATVRFPRDPRDEPCLNLAIAAKTDFLVSWDRDLPSVAGDAAFRKEHSSLSIVNPEVFLHQVRTRTRERAA